MSPRRAGPYVRELESLPESPYARRLTEEALEAARRFPRRAWEMARSLAEWEEFSPTMPRGTALYKGALAAAVRELTGQGWDDIGRELGYGGFSPGNTARSAARLTLADDEAANAAQLVYLVTYHALVDQYLAERAECVEALETLAEVGFVVRLPDGRYRRPAPAGEPPVPPAAADAR